MSSIFLWDHLLSQMGLFLCGFAGPLLSYASSHIDRFSLLQEAHLFYSPPLNIQDIPKAIFILSCLYVQFFWQSSLLPINGWIENIKEGVSQNDALLSQRGNIEALKLLFPCVEDSKPTVVGNFTLTVFHSIHVIYHNRFNGFMVSNAHSFPGRFVQEVFRSTAINQNCFFGLLAKRSKRNLHIDCRDSSYVHFVLFTRNHPQPGCRHWTF